MAQTTRICPLRIFDVDRLRAPPDDYDVIDADGREIGRIFKPGAGVPDDRPWMWTIGGSVFVPGKSHGFAATRDEAKAAFAATWRTWLALQQGAQRRERLDNQQAGLRWL